MGKASVSQDSVLYSVFSAGANLFSCAIPVFYQERLNIQPQMTQDQSLVSGLNGSLQLSVSVPQPPQASQFLDEQEQYQGEVEIDLETFFYLDMPMYGSWIEEPRYGI